MSGISVFLRIGAVCKILATKAFSGSTPAGAISLRSVIENADHRPS